MSAGLAAIQRGFLEAILDEAAFADAAPRDAIAFYRRSVRANQAAALRATYPVVVRLVGDAFFDECARLYAIAEPSASGDLHLFGARFAEFLARYAPASTVPFLPDVARLEWAVHECAHAADTPPFDFAALAAVPPDSHGRLRVRLAPAVRWISSDHPVAAFWEANQAGCDGTPARQAGADHVLVSRAGAGVCVERIEPVALRLLERFAAGESLDAAVGEAGREADALPALLSRWTAAGVIAALELPA